MDEPDIKDLVDLAVVGGDVEHQLQISKDLIINVNIIYKYNTKISISKIGFENNDNISIIIMTIIFITTSIIIIASIKPEGRQLHKQCWQEQDLRWPEKDLIVLQNKSNPKKIYIWKKKQARKPRSYASSKLQPTHWRGWSVELLA